MERLSLFTPRLTAHYGILSVTRIAVLHEELCQPKNCQNECHNFCPPVRNGIEVITWLKNNKPLISEELCIGCGICIHKCPFDAISIINLPDDRDKEIVHRYGQNDFRLFGIPTPQQGKVVGLLGANGTGKTTALSLLSGDIVPNLGEWEVLGENTKVLDYFSGTELHNHFKAVQNGEMKVVVKPQYVDQIPKIFKGTLRNLLENVASKDEVEAITKEMKLTNLDLSLSKLSGGELQKGAIAATLLKKADLYLIDEPSSYLDIEQRLLVSKLIKKIGNEKRVIIVEHDLAILDFIAEELNILYGKENAYGMVAKTLATRNGINSYLEGYLKEENVRIREDRIKFLEHPPRSSWKNESLATWPEMKKEYSNFCLEIEAGEILQGQVLGVVGKNATGKTTFVKMIAGVENPDKGKMDMEVKVAYKPQYIEADEKSIVGDVLRSVKGFDEQFFSTELERPMSLTALMEREMSSLSGGELQRVAIAKCLLKEAELYLLDEPSAYLDANQRMIAARTIRRVMEHRGCSALVVDHDVYFIDYVSDGIILFEGESGKSGRMLGPYKMREGMNEFLKRVGVTFRRDKNTYRPRINNPDSRLDRLQKAKGEYYYPD